jgi:AcrR family transcriptional regulator
VRVREQLVAAASQLYAAGGEAAVSFASVAGRTGLRKATVFHYFPNKDALTMSVFQALGERLEAVALGWFDAPPASFTARLDRLLSSLVDFYGADPLNARILCHGLLATERFRATPATAEAVPPIFAHFIRRFTDFLAGGATAGEFYDDRPAGVMMAIGGVILFESMLPARARGYDPHRSGPVALAERKKEIIAFVRRAVVRPRTRLVQHARAMSTRRTRR